MRVAPIIVTMKRAGDGNRSGSRWTAAWLHESEGRFTLHEAVAEVLRTAPDRMMRAGDLAMEIQRRRLYTMRDGRPVEPQQIHARVGHYLDLFEKVGTFIKLRDDEAGSA